VLRHDGARTVRLGGIEATVRIEGAPSAEAFALLELRLAIGAFAGAPHIHTREHGFSYVVSGELAAMVGERTVRLGPGEVLFKPRGIAHTFWNPGPSRALLLELIAPAWLASWFFDVAAAFPAEGRGARDPRDVFALGRPYGLVYPGTQEYFAELLPLLTAPAADRAERVVSLARRHGIGSARVETPQPAR